MSATVGEQFDAAPAPRPPGGCHDDYPDAYIRSILASVHTIALVGASPHWNRPSYFAMKYLQTKGFRVIPVNPRAAGDKILGETVYAKLADIGQPVDMVQIFRNAKAAGPITDEAIEIGARVVWMQLSVRNNEACAARRGRRPDGHHGPLSQDRICKAAWRVELERHQFARDH